MRKPVLVLLTVLMAASACASNDSDKFEPAVEPPPLQLVHVDESPTPTTTFTDPVVGPGGPQERDDTTPLPPPVTYPSTAPDGVAVTEPQTVALGLMLCGTGLVPADFTGDGEPDSCLVATQLPAGTQLLDIPVVVWVVPGVCPDGGMFVEVLTIVSDDGCRPVSCLHGWGFDGYCIQQLAYQTPPGAVVSYTNTSPPLSGPPPVLSAERQAMVAEDFGRVSVYLTEEQAGCRPWADAVTNRCVLDAQDGLQLCFGWVTVRNGLGWEPCPRHVDHDGTGRATETITDDNPMFHLRHDSLFGYVTEGRCATSDCAWAVFNNPAVQSVRCAQFWEWNLHLAPGDGGRVCGPPDGCVRWYVVVADRCLLDEELWCHAYSGVWRGCSLPTALQPSAAECPSTAGADWVNRGRLMALTFGRVSKHQIVLTPGVWRFTLCVRGNHHERTQSHIDAGGPGFEVRGPWRFDYPRPNGDPSFDGWGITPHHTDPGAGDCPDPASDGQRYTHMFCVVSADDWNHHRVMVVSSTGQNPPFITHLRPANRRYQAGYWEITATRIS